MPNVVAVNPGPSRRLVAALEGLPLAIRVAGRLLAAEFRMGWGIVDPLEEIIEGAALLTAQPPADRLGPATQTIPTVSALLRQAHRRHGNARPGASARPCRGFHPARVDLA